MTPAMTTAECPIDLDHLNRYTGGNRGLNEEILRLFEDQCTATLAGLEELARADGVGSRSWLQLTHTLKGAARGVGAFGVADIAAEAEKIPRDAALDVVHRLKEKSSAVHLFVDQLLKSPT
jgi:HPt (histidine-containing phosphotransfer) domain-containing protein